MIIGENDKETFIATATYEISRPGIQEMIKYLGETDFYEAPCSTIYHLNVAGGLVKHCLNVYQAMKNLSARYELGTSETCAIVSLLHDVCKANFYAKGTRNRKENGKWIEVTIWEVKDQFPMGHGEKSLHIVSHFLKLTREEALAIRWHMGAFDPGIHFNFGRYPFQEASATVPLLKALMLADQEATYFLDGKNE